MDVRRANLETAAEEARSLAVLVNSTGSAMLSFALYETEEELMFGQQELVEALEVPVSGIMTPLDGNLLHAIPAPGPRRCFLVRGLDAAMPKVLGHLNFIRDDLLARPDAFVFWVNGKILKQVANGAPDLWSRKSGVFDFRSDEWRMTSQLVGLWVTGHDQSAAEIPKLVQMLAAEEARRPARRHALIRLHQSIAMALVGSGDRDLALHHAERSVAVADSTQRIRQSLQARRRAGLVAASLGRWDRAGRWLDEALDIARSRGTSVQLADVHRDMGLVCYQRGQFARASDLFLQAATGHEMREPLSAARDLFLAGSATRASGKIVGASQILVDALGRLDDGIQLGMNSEDALLLNLKLEILLELARARIDENELHAAEVALAEAAPLARLEAAFAPEVHLVFASLHRRRGNYNAARDELARALAGSKASGGPRSRRVATAAVWHEIGLLEYERKNFDEAIAALQHSIDVARKGSQRLGPIFSSAQLGLIYREQGDLGRSLGWYGKAYKLAEKEAPGIMPRLAEDLRRLRVQLGPDAFANKWRDDFSEDPPL